MSQKLAFSIVFSSIIIFLCCQQVGSIKCWVCRSEVDPKCKDPFDNSTLPIEDCRLKAPLPHLPGVRAELCRKTRQKVFGHWRYYRGCAYLGEPGIHGDERFCVMRTGTYNIFIEYCTCNSKDGCNTGSLHSIKGPFILLCTKSTVKPLCFTYDDTTRDPASYVCATKHLEYERERRKTEIALREACYFKMANTISNIKMTNAIKNLVSKRRKRYIQDGYNLDLTYIRDNLIAMGFPAEKLEGVYRNHIDDVVKFLESKHKDHYKIYNLCSERSYDVNRFHGRVSTYPFNDHNPPRLELIQPFCQDVNEWLSQDCQNVAAVHCKAGKGRTGVMICCYMLHSNQFQSADDALGFYGQMRTHDRKGVTIPSQRRYVGYYAELLREGLMYEPSYISIREIRLAPLPVVNELSPVQIVISDLHSRIYVSPIMELKRLCRFLIEDDLRLIGDIKVELFHKPKMKRSEKLFHYWFNTFFVRELAAPDAFLNGTDETEGVRGDRSARALSCDGTGKPPAVRSTRANSLTAVHSLTRPLVLHLRKPEIDSAHKDKQHKIFTENFTVSMFFHKVPDSYSDATPRPAVQSPSQTTPSESSEADSTDCSTGEEDGWDSGETTYL